MTTDALRLTEEDLRSVLVALRLLRVNSTCTPAQAADIESAIAITERALARLQRLLATPLTAT